MTDRNRTAALSAVGLLFVPPAAAQQFDSELTINHIGGTAYELNIEFFGTPEEEELLDSAWSEANFDLASTDGVFTDIDFHPRFELSLFGAPVVTGLGSSTVEVRGATMPSSTFFDPPVFEPFPGNPFTVATFDYTGTVAGLFEAWDLGLFTLVGQNSISFTDPANPNFGDREFYQDAFGNPGTRTIGLVPAPSGLAALTIAGLATTRRRR